MLGELEQSLAQLLVSVQHFSETYNLRHSTQNTLAHTIFHCSMSFPGSPWFDPGLPPPTYQQIMELVDHSVHDAADSRTAALTLKRHRGEGSQRGSSRGSSKQSTPRKKVKYAENVGRQDIADFVPTGANFSASNLDISMDHEKLDDAPKSATQDPGVHVKSTKETMENGTLHPASSAIEAPVAQHPGQIPSSGVIAPGLMHKMDTMAVKGNPAYVQGKGTFLYRT